MKKSATIEFLKLFESVSMFGLICLYDLQRAQTLGTMFLA